MTGNTRGSTVAPTSNQTAKRTRKMGTIRDSFSRVATVRRDTLQKVIREGWHSMTIQTKDSAYDDHIRSAKRNKECPKEVPEDRVIDFLDSDSTKAEVLLDETGIEGGQVVRVKTDNIRANFKRFRVELDPDEIQFV